jgi:hypothetical protein
MHVISQANELTINTDGPTLGSELDTDDSAVTNEQEKANEKELTADRTIDLQSVHITRFLTKFMIVIVFSRANWLKLMNSGGNRFESPSGYRIS